MGEKNFLHFGNDDAGQNIAMLYSFVSMCEANGINPIEYLSDVLIRVQTHPASRIDELLPHRWSPPTSGGDDGGGSGRGGSGGADRGDDREDIVVESDSVNQQSPAQEGEHSATSTTKDTDENASLTAHEFTPAAFNDDGSSMSRLTHDPKDSYLSDQGELVSVHSQSELQTKHASPIGETVDVSVFDIATRTHEEQLSDLDQADHRAIIFGAHVNPTCNRAEASHASITCLQVALIYAALGIDLLQVLNVRPDLKARLFRPIKNAPRAQYVCSRVDARLFDQSNIFDAALARRPSIHARDGPFRSLNSAFVSGSVGARF